MIEDDIMKNLKEHHFKITIFTAITVILFIISMTYNSATWKSDMENRQRNTNVKQVEINERLIELEKENIEFRIQMAMIETKLSNIEALLMDMKKDLKDKQEKNP